MKAEAADGVTTVRFDHPPVNALDLDLLDDIIVTMHGVDGPVVLTGAGRCFSAGVDLRAIVDGGADYTGPFHDRPVRRLPCRRSTIRPRWSLRSMDMRSRAAAYSRWPPTSG